MLRIRDPKLEALNGKFSEEDIHKQVKQNKKLKT